MKGTRKYGWQKVKQKKVVGACRGVVHCGLAETKSYLRVAVNHYQGAHGTHEGIESPRLGVGCTYPDFEVGGHVADSIVF